MKALAYLASFVVLLVLLIAGTIYVFSIEDTSGGAGQIAGTVRTLVMPGPVSEAHKKYEQQCSECHAPFSKVTQNSLCLKCHEDIQADIDKKSGFHGRTPTISTAQCKTCHTEHEGQDFNIIKLEKSAFRHDLTDFPLADAHASPSLGCESCHKEGQAFRDAKSGCFDCHEKDDTHKGKLGQDCARCHEPFSWKKARFDHRETKFPLTGKHESVECDKCHKDATFEGAPLDCYSCHQKDDKHKSEKTRKCEACHTPEKWTSTRSTFDHKKETGFGLEGKHEFLACKSCHKDLDFTHNEKEGCFNCHKDDDVHKGTNGRKCEQCHNSADWSKVSFDHDRDTHFKLLGAHKNLDCVDCHEQNSKTKKIGTSCNLCHKADDVHKGKLGANCNKCHNEKSWTENVAFNHDATSFPLIGIHAVTDCEECHKTKAFKGTSTACVSCHAQKDYHKKTLGNNCAKCHNPNGWKLWQFDHNSQTDFRLEGKHEGLACKECHKTASENGKITAEEGCYDCHKSDNIHKGAFGTLENRCNLCHNSIRFKTVLRKSIVSFHNEPEKFGVDLSAQCASCHKKDDVHEGNFGPRCDQCHNVSSFEDVRIRK
ncbi:MAG: cytochrome C [Alphaproteobacteria bacterium]|nr:cytochrome C [Alphaproteobacteria bacterium]